VDEPGIVIDEPKLNVEVHTSDDVMLKEEAVSVAGMLESNEPCVKGLIEKEPMDFEACISVNEISKYDNSQGKVSEGMDLSYQDENAGSRALVMDQHMMDFEVEISATHISKPKQTVDRIECNTQMSVENKVILSEMKEESVTIHETAEVLTEDERFVGEKHDLIVRQRKDEIAMEKLVQEDGNNVQLTCTELIPGSLQQDESDARELTMMEEKVLHDRTVAQQVVQELDITRCDIKARTTSESSSSVDKLQLSSDFEGGSQDVKPQRTSTGASSFQNDIILVDAKTDCQDIKVYRDNKATAEEQKSHDESCGEEGKIHRAMVEGSSSKVRSVEHDIVPCDKIGIYERKSYEPSSKESYAECDNIPSDETETCKSKVCKSSNIAGSVQHEIGSSDNIETCERKVHKPSSREGSVLREDVHLDENETCERKVRKPSSRASSIVHEDIPSVIDGHNEGAHRSSSRADSIQREDVPSDDTEMCETKVCKRSSKASSVQHGDAHPNETEPCERKVHKPSSREGSVQGEDVYSDGNETREKKVRKPRSRASSVVREDIPSVIGSHKKKAHRSSSRVNSVQCENVQLDETETCQREVCKHSSRAVSLQCEDVSSDEIEVRKFSNIAGSVHGEIVPSDKIETCEKKNQKPSSRANSVQLEYDHSDEIETGERKVRKPSSRASSVQREDIPSVIDSHSERVHRSSSRANSVQREDVHSDETETRERNVCRPSSRADSVHSEDVSSNERKVHKPSSRAGSIQREDVHSDDIEASERKVCKGRSRASHVQHEVPVDKTRRIRKHKSKSGSIHCEDVSCNEMGLSLRKYKKPVSRVSSIQHEDVPFDESDGNVKDTHKLNRIDAAQQQVVPTTKTESVEKTVWKHNLKAGSVRRHLEVIEEEESQNTRVGKPESDVNSVHYVDIASENTASGICRVVERETSDCVKCIDVTNENSHYRASSVDCRDVTAADFACNENRSPTALSVNSDASTVVPDGNAHWTGHTKKSSASSACSSAQGDDGKDSEAIKLHSNKSSQAGVIQQNILDVNEASKKIIEASNTSGKVRKFGRRAKKKCSQAGPSHGTNIGSILEVKNSDLEDPIKDSSVSKIIRESKDMKDKIKRSSASGCVDDAGSVKLNLTPASAMHCADLATKTNGKKEKTSEAVFESVSVSGLDGQGIYRKAKSECEYVVVPNIENKRFTRSTLGISSRTTATVTGSMTDNSASTKKSQRSDIGSERMGYSLLDTSCSEGSSGSSLQWKRKAYSPTRGDRLRTQQVIEEYTTNRRLTRHQRSVLERSLELTKSPLSQLR
jgi:hypothetical protein